jgi:YrbI family 3-deoxy-D-manno-octulosonate 8-phosphate phosphatase
MKFLIAGLGSIGRRHLRNLLKLNESDIVLFRTFKSTLPDEELLNFPVETNIHAALAHRPDAVIISNPTAHHMDVAIPAAEAGCHLLIEKPISHNFEKLDDLKAALQNKYNQVLVGYNFRFHPHFQETKILLDEGKIGRPLSARAHYGDYLPQWHPWEDYRQGYSARAELGGGVSWTLCHPLDYLMWFLGEAKTSRALTDKISDLEILVEDIAEYELRFEKGAVGSAQMNYYQQPPAHYFEIVGTEGTIRWNQDDNILRIYKSSSDCWVTIPAPVDFERNDMFLSEMKHFIDIVYGKAKPSCTLLDGERVLNLILKHNSVGSFDLSNKYRRRPLPEVITLIIFDFDGVMTDNCALVDEQGNEQVIVNRSDGMGISLLQRQKNINMMVLSTETNATVSARCKKLGIPVIQGVEDKAKILNNWLATHQIDPGQVIYVGNDVNDIPCFSLIAYSIVPADAHPLARRKADMILKNKGGKGAVREVCDLLINLNTNDKNEGCKDV